MKVALLTPKPDPPAGVLELTRVKSFMLSDPDADITTLPPDSTIVTLNPDGVAPEVGVTEGVPVTDGVGAAGVPVKVGVTDGVGVGVVSIGVPVGVSVGVGVKLSEVAVGVGVTLATSQSSQVEYSESTVISSVNVLSGDAIV